MLKIISPSRKDATEVLKLLSLLSPYKWLIMWSLHEVLKVTATKNKTKTLLLLSVQSLIIVNVPQDKAVASIVKVRRDEISLCFIVFCFYSS